MDTIVYICVLALCLTGESQADQDLVNNIGRYLNITYHVLDNFANTWITFDGKLTFLNTGPDIPAGNSDPWTIYFCNVRLMEPERIQPDGAELGTSGIKVYHVQGSLHKLEPMSTFAGIAQGASLEISFQASDWSIARTDVMPNWYVTAAGAEARTIDSTAGYSLNWVAAFDTPNKWKRQPNDAYNPYTAGDRLTLWEHQNTGLVKHVIPTAVSENLDDSKTMNIYLGDWVVVYGSPDVTPEANFLASKLDTIAVSQPPASHFILLDLNISMSQSEAYTLNNDYNSQVITIYGKDRAGVFYGLQTLLSLAEPSGNVPDGDVMDYPRFGYRGMFADVARNFRSKEDMMVLLDVMGMYKLNKFHFHITDDEGWRLEIPGLPELTEVGSYRCHDMSGDVCLMPQLGSPQGFGSNDGIGFYTIADYREILQYASERHIEVIPEFDTPAHSHAAINAMLSRYRTYMAAGNTTAAEEFLLSEIDDPSEYLSVQKYTDNSINPCITSTYTFMAHLMREVKEMHSDIQPLTTFNFGGDEVPHGAWVNSTACINSQNSTEEMKQEFVMKIGEMAKNEGLDLSGWEDGFTKEDGNGGIVPIDVDELLVDNVYGYFWNNVWEWGFGERAYVMANAGYKAILSHATHLYFDHPYEPDPEDRGFYWATRIASTQKTFNFMPDSMYENIGVDNMGNPLDKDQICEDFGCTPLEPGKEDNIVGMQGQLWSETVRTSDDFDYLVYNRLIALAERAWHKASWESISDATEREAPMKADWEEFANTLGHKELARLSFMGISYAVQPPGARIDGATFELFALAEFPGLPIWYSSDQGITWTRYVEGTILENSEICGNTEIHLITSSDDNVRQSRLVTVDVAGMCAELTSGANIMHMSIVVISVLITGWVPTLYTQLSLLY